ncbi:uncharacterized protein LOC144114594 [Amblyomma americanum]
MNLRFSGIAIAASRTYLLHDCPHWGAPANAPCFGITHIHFCEEFLGTDNGGRPAEGSIYAVRGSCSASQGNVRATSTRSSGSVEQLARARERNASSTAAAFDSSMDGTPVHARATAGDQTCDDGRRKPRQHIAKGGAINQYPGSDSCKDGKCSHQQWFPSHRRFVFREEDDAAGE